MSQFLLAAKTHISQQLWSEFNVSLSFVALPQHPCTKKATHASQQRQVVLRANFSFLLFIPSVSQQSLSRATHMSQQRQVVVADREAAEQTSGQTLQLPLLVAEAGPVVVEQRTSLLSPQTPLLAAGAVRAVGAQKLSLLQLILSLPVVGGDLAGAVLWTSLLQL